MKQNNFLIRIREIGGKKKTLQLLRDGIKLFFEYASRKIFKYKRSFLFCDKKFIYFYYPYNATWRNERCIEVPIIWQAVKANKGKEILELGNVLSHYFHVNHTILDKYEKAREVINEDAVDFYTNKKFNLIVAISTLEHIGWDEEPRDPLKIIKAINNLKNNLNKNGKIIASIPLGYNPNIDGLIKRNKIFDKQYYMKRISRSNEWKQVSLDEVKDIKYGYPFPFANAIVIGVIEN